MRDFQDAFNIASLGSAGAGRSSRGPRTAVGSRTGKRAAEVMQQIRGHAARQFRLSLESAENITNLVTTRLVATRICLSGRMGRLYGQPNRHDESWMPMLPFGPITWADILRFRSTYVDPASKVACPE